MGLISYQRPLLSQPDHLARINEKHWLANRLMFVHSGHAPFWWHKPGSDQAGPLRKALAAAPGNPALAGAMGWVPDGMSSETYQSSDDPARGGLCMLYPLTLSVWWVGINSSTDDTILALARGDGNFNGGFALERRFNRVRVYSMNTASALTAALATGGYTSGQWQHAVGAFHGRDKRVAFADAGFSATNTGAQDHTLNLSRVRLCTTPQRIGEDIPATDVIKGVALPMVINGVLEQDEVTRLFNEQRSNPWAIFAERPIWVPVSSASGFRAAWVPHASQVIGAR